jgi:hypothetical protein
MDERSLAAGDRLLHALRARARDFDLDVDDRELLEMLEAELCERGQPGDDRRQRAVQALKLEVR